MPTPLLTLRLNGTPTRVPLGDNTGAALTARRAAEAARDDAVAQGAAQVALATGQAVAAGSARDAAIAFMNPFADQAAGEAGTVAGDPFSFLDTDDRVALAKRTAGGSDLLDTYFGGDKVAVPHPWFPAIQKKLNKADFPVIEDAYDNVGIGNAVADTEAFQAWADEINANGGGVGGRMGVTYNLGDTVWLGASNSLSKQRFLKGNGSIIVPDGNLAGKPLFDCVGIDNGRAFEISGWRYEDIAGAVTPECFMGMARPKQATGVKSSGNFFVVGNTVYGWFTAPTWRNVSSESNIVFANKFWNYHPFAVCQALTRSDYFEGTFFLEWDAATGAFITPGETLTGPNGTAKVLHTVRDYGGAERGALVGVTGGFFADNEVFTASGGGGGTVNMPGGVHKNGPVSTNPTAQAGIYVEENSTATFQSLLANFTNAASDRAGMPSVFISDFVDVRVSEHNSNSNAATASGAAGAAGSFVTGRKYKIATVGTTDFVAIGALANTVGLIFTATGAGSGTGTATTLTSPGTHIHFQEDETWKPAYGQPPTGLRLDHLYPHATHLDSITFGDPATGGGSPIENVLISRPRSSGSPATMRSRVKYIGKAGVTYFCRNWEIHSDDVIDIRNASFQGNNLFNLVDTSNAGLYANSTIYGRLLTDKANLGNGNISLTMADAANFLTIVTGGGLTIEPPETPLTMDASGTITATRTRHRVENYPVPAGSFVVGRQYQIATAGTTSFTAIGAANNNVNTVFTATGAGSGTGTARATSQDLTAVNFETGVLAAKVVLRAANSARAMVAKANARIIAPSDSALDATTKTIVLAGDSSSGSTAVVRVTGGRLS